MAPEVRLSKSLRKYIRKKKSEIRRHHGPRSPQERELLEWAKKARKEKQSRVSEQL